MTALILDGMISYGAITQHFTAATASLMLQIISNSMKLSWNQLHDALGIKNEEQPLFPEREPRERASSVGTLAKKN